LTVSSTDGDTESAFRAFVIHPALKAPKEADGAARSPEARLAEAVGLAEAIELDVAGSEVVRLPRFRPGTLLGSGTVESIGERIKEGGVGVVIVDATVSPVQQRNLERAWNCKVIDRTGLILEIFGARARTHEGRL
jgi:GTPase